MTTSAPFLNTPYGGYAHHRVPSEDAELTHVGPGTPAGEWFRRFWQPVAVSEDLKDLPVAIRILGEDLVLFRDGSGQVGLLELHCSHRGTSLEFGQIQQRGIRCCYHAWLYDVDGKLLETPGEPAESTLKDRLYHGAYPTLEYKGLVFAYMGPPDKRPPFPILDVFDLPGSQLLAGLHFNNRPCNWLQSKENAMDPAHFAFLHVEPGSTGFSQNLAEVGELDLIETPIGMACIDAGRVGEWVWVHLVDFILPNIHQGSDIMWSIEQRSSLNRVPWMTWWTVPVDDTHTMQLGFWHGREGQDLRTEQGFGQTGDRPHEERQRVPGDYDSLVSQRPIVVHAMQHLGDSDSGVTMLRNMVREGIRAVQRGEDPKGINRNEGEIIPTYAHDRMLPIPPEPTREKDRQLLRDTGRKVAKDYVKALSSRLWSATAPPGQESKEGLNREIMATMKSSLDNKGMLWLYQTMVTVRQFEQRAQREADSGKPIRGIHSSAGQEAVAAGVCAHLRQGDYVLGTHRSHHHCLAKGVDMSKMMAELMGKNTGTNKGKGGSMHIADIEVGMLGANGVVGSNVPVATGVALSAKVRGTDQVSVVFFGDGGANQGSLHESMNLAAIWKLPVIFVCENNRYAESTPVEYALAGGSVWRRAAGYDMPGAEVDGQDVLTVYDVAEEAVRRARSGEGPTLIEALTYRYGGHYGADNTMAYRTREEEEYYRSRDCIETFKKQLIESENVTMEELEAIDQGVLKALDEAVRFADDSPWPGPEELEADVYVSYP